MKKNFLSLALLGVTAFSLTGCGGKLGKPKDHYTGTLTASLKQKNLSDIEADYGVGAVDQRFFFDIKIEAKDSVIQDVSWNVENKSLLYIKSYWSQDDKTEVGNRIPQMLAQFKDVTFDDFYTELMGDGTEEHPSHDVYFTSGTFSGAVNRSRFSVMQDLTYTGRLIETGVILCIFNAITA